MKLSEFVTECRLKILAELQEGRDPSIGAFNPEALSDARTYGLPQLGTVVFGPDRLQLEFIYASSTASIVFKVELIPPERIVYMPVPDWVIEQIWQGSIAGSFQFESDALGLLKNFETELAPANNQKHFEPRAPTRRE